MTEPVLAYAPADGNREIRRAGVVLVLWGSVQAPVGVIIAGCASIILLLNLVVAAFAPGDRDPFYFFLLFGVLLVLVGGIALASWGVNTLKTGVALMRGAPRPFGVHLVLTRVAEIAAYSGILLYIMVCIHDHVWKIQGNLWYSIIFFPVYLLLPWALTSTRLVLDRAVLAPMASARATLAQQAPS